MLVENEKALRDVFKNCETTITTHCEDENTIKENLKKVY